MTSAGRERQGHGLLVEFLSEHIETQMRALDLLEQHGYAFPDRIIRVLAAADRRVLGERIANAVSAPAALETLTHDYYDGLRFMISARSASGDHIPLIDGGCFDWLRKLTSNNRLVFVASGFGSQLAAHLYRR